MADSSALDAALVAALSADNGVGGLMTLMPDGVFMDMAPSGATRFVLVSVVIAEDSYVFEGIAWEQVLYLVKAVERSSSGAGVSAAAARIHTLLQGAALSITGYTNMLCRRTERVRYTEVDPEDNDARWQHRGGRYEITASPN